MRSNATGGRGRSRQENVAGGRTQRVNVRLSKSDYDALKKQAATAGMTVPRILVERALADDTGTTKTDLANLRHSVNQLTTQINKVGTNLNQIAHATNAAGTVPTGLEHALAEGILEYRHLMMKAKRIYEADES